MNDFDTFTKLPKNVWDLGKLIVAKRFKKSPKVQKNCQIWSHCSQRKLLVDQWKIVLTL